MMSLSKRALISAAISFAFALTAYADDSWYPSKYGADDTLGAINNLTHESVIQAAKLVKTGKSYPLGIVTGWDSPAYPPRFYSITILEPGQAGLAAPSADRATSNDDLLHTYMGVGSQIDGLGHMGWDNVYYNGNHAKDFVNQKGLKKLSVDQLPPIVARGVLLDMTDYFDQPIVAKGTQFNEKEIKAQAKAQGVSIGRGDVVLFHTGWLNLAGKDNDRFMAGEPGLGVGVGGAKFLAELGVVAIGADTWGLEALPSGVADVAFPVHPELLARHGVYILENRRCSQPR